MRQIVRGCLALVLLTRTAVAQEPANTEADPPPESAEPESAEPAPAEPDDTEAAPEVQKQMGLGTQKEEPTAAAPEEPPPVKAPGDSKEVGEDDAYGHGMQAGLRVGLVPGYRVFFRYEDSPFCKRPDPPPTPVNEQQKICGFVAPLATEVAISFAPFDSFEPYLFGRFGLAGESETNTEALKLVGVGTRIYTMADSRFKIFVEPALALEFEDGAGNPIYNPMTEGFDPSYGTDFVFHLGIGPQFDVAKAVGFFLNVGLDVGILRAIHSTLLGNVGVQIRVP